MPFTDTWNALQTNLIPGATIQNWTAANGFLGDTFTVTDVGLRHVKLNIAGAKNVQNVQIEDFETVYNLWQPYCRGGTSRAQIRDATRFSKYVISIFHWLEHQSGGQLP